MRKCHIVLAAAMAAASVPALADKASPDPAATTAPAASADLSGNGAPWKGTLTRAEVTAEFLNARASGTLPVSDAYDDPMVMKMAGPQWQPRPLALPRFTASAPQVMGAAPSDPVTLDGYRFVGGEAGYAPANAAGFR